MFHIFKEFKDKHGLFKKISVTKYSEILSSRNNAHYSILGSLDHSNSMAYGKYFYYFPVVYNVINQTLADLSYIWGNRLPPYSGVYRFRELSSMVDTFLQNANYEHLLDRLDRVTY